MKRIALLLILFVLVAPVSAEGFLDFLFPPTPEPTPVPIQIVGTMETSEWIPDEVVQVQFNNESGSLGDVEWLAQPLEKSNGTQPVQFYATTINAAYWKWDFGNGETSELENPLAIYNQSGGYAVTLLAGNNKYEKKYTNPCAVSVNLQDGAL